MRRKTVEQLTYVSGLTPRAIDDLFNLMKGISDQEASRKGSKFGVWVKNVREVISRYPTRWKLSAGKSSTTRDSESLNETT